MKIELWDIGRVIPYDKNPRKNDGAVDALAKSITEFGFRQPIVVDQAGIIVVGHTRWKAAVKLRLAQVPVHIASDLTEAQIKAYRIADNQTASIATWDYELLPIEIRDLQELNFDIGLLSFDAKELARILDPDRKGGHTDPDEPGEVPDKAMTEAGDIWLLGEHRLICGDSTKPETYAKLLEGKKAKMMFTDPPWNVAIGLDSNPRHRQRKGLQNDNMTGEDFQKFLDGFAGCVVPHILGDIYCVLGASEWPRLDSTLRSHGFHWSATVIWVKDIFVLGRSKYHRRYEPLWYGWHEKANSSFNDRRDLDDVWEIPRPKRSEEHPTMKPVELCCRAIQNSSVAGDIILEPFGGSGSTLIAAEQLGRRCYSVELEPVYCDVIKNRWEKFTGKTAERIIANDKNPA